MPSVSKKQRKLMRAAAHNPKFAKKVGIKQSVAREFYEADKRRGYSHGGSALTAAERAKIQKEMERRILGIESPPPVPLVEDETIHEYQRRKRQKRNRRYARGGLASLSTSGPRDPLRTPPGSVRGALGSLGSTAKLGPLGAPSSRPGGFTSRSATPRGGALEASGIAGPRVGSNVRPRPGRGVNPLLATSGTNYHLAKDRLDSLRRRLQ